MKKYLFIPLLCSVFILPLFPQTPPEQMLSERAVNSFINNFGSIMQELEAYKDGLDALNRELEKAGGNSPVAAILALEVPAEIDRVFRDYGMGDEGYKKMMIITTGYSIISLEAAMEFGITNTDNPKIKNDFRNNLDALSRLKADFHPNDLLLIKAKKEILKPLLV